MQTPCLSVSHLTKHYGKTVAVNDISFHVNRGEIVGFLGPNGAGKTTTLAMLLGIITPTSGTITIFDKHLETNREEILSRMNYSSAYVHAPYRLTVREHLLVFAHMYQVARPQEKVTKMLETFQLTPIQHQLAGDLSSGNAARVNLAKAFINNPELILLDEPTSSLDPDIADRVRQFIAASRKTDQTTVLITSHNMAEIEELCDRIIFLDRGKIISEDTPEHLANNIRHAHVHLMMTDGQKRTVAYCKRHHLPIDINDRSVTITVSEQKIAELLSQLSALSVSYSEISINKPTLEEYFIGKSRHE